MATIEEIKDKIARIKAIGRANLAEKGVTCTEDSTICDIMCRIADCKVGEDVLDPEGVEF